MQKLHALLRENWKDKIRIFEISTAKRKKISKPLKNSRNQRFVARKTLKFNCWKIRN